jgi:hypothetical protein
MKKSILYIVILTIATFSLTGCGNKVRVLEPQKVVYKEGITTEKVWNVRLDMLDGRALLRSSDAEDSSLAILERVALFTLESGHSYFAIYAPYRISNFKGSTINTLQDFKEDCLGDTTDKVLSMVDAFGISENACGIAYAGNQNQAFLDYVMYDTPSDEILVWDAKKLLEDIKKEKGLISDGAGWEIRTYLGSDDDWESSRGAKWWSDSYPRWGSTQRQR